MLSMKTGINTESMCLPSGVQRLTQDRRFNTTQTSGIKIDFAGYTVYLMTLIDKIVQQLGLNFI